MSKSAFSHTVSFSQFSGAQAEQIFERLREERQLTVCNENVPIAVLLSPEEYHRLLEIEENYRLLLLAQARMEKNDGVVLNEADVMHRLGISETELAQAADLEIETDDQYLRSSPSNLKRLLASIDQLKRKK